MLRVAIFSDVHGNLAALRAVLAAIDGHRPVHLTAAAGDLVGPEGARPAETFDTLVERGVVMLQGNHDDFTARHDAPPGPWAALYRRRLPWCIARLGPERIERLRRLPRQLRLSPAPGDDLLIVHASMHDRAGRAAAPATDSATLHAWYGGASARVIAFGHWHEAFVRQWEEGTLINVASVSLPKDGLPLAAYSMLTWDGGWLIEQFRVPYDVAEEEAAASAAGLPV